MSLRPLVLADPAPPTQGVAPPLPGVLCRDPPFAATLLADDIIISPKDWQMYELPIVIDAPGETILLRSGEQREEAGSEGRRRRHTHPPGAASATSPGLHGC